VNPYTVLLVFLIPLFACDDTVEQQRLLEEKRKEELLPPEHTIIEIEGCEYFRYHSTHAYVHITHKGNCKNPVHCYNN
jgi:hypothetical protein